MVPIFLFVTNSIFYAVLMLVKTLYDDHCNGLFNCRKQRIFIAYMHWNETHYYPTMHNNLSFVSTFYCWSAEVLLHIIYTLT